MYSHKKMFRQFEKLYGSMNEASLNVAINQTCCLLPCSYKEYKIDRTQMDVVNILIKYLNKIFLRETYQKRRSKELDF
jgi:hypothetical protein